MSGPPAPPPAPGGLGVEERVLQRPQGRLRYLVVGSGPALVLCHGFLGSAENFETWLPELAARRRLLIPDLPGFGASAPLPGPHTAPQLAREVAAVAAAEGAATYDLGGLCLGASVALALHRLDPPAARTLILHTPLLHPSVVRRRFHRQVAVFTAPGVFAGIARVARNRLVSDLYKRWVVEGSGPVDTRSAQ
ncbi:MAG TPA: alpha/beta fold hydrolase, partial [Candidatus Dormibacteraeota bacterium]|nr:alpha/beta fold hydrolase [Candidatus Dormibacteraeota bacterium]